MAEKPMLRDVVDVEYLQHLQDTFSAVTGLATVVIDPDGRHITKGSGINAFCAMMQTNPKGQVTCLATNEQLCRENRKKNGPVVLRCKNSGLLTAGVPIFLDKEHLGSWIVGQVRACEPSVPMLQETSAKTGIPMEQMLRAIEDLPVMGEREFADALKFLETLSEVIIRLSRIGTEMAKSNVELRLITAQLENTAQMLRRFVDSSDVGMYVADYHTGELLMVNRTYAEAFGEEPDNMLGKKCWEISGPPDCHSFCPYCAREELLDENHEPVGPVYWENHLEHHGKWMRITSQALKWDDGRLAHMVTFLDITQEHNMREELAQLAYYDRTMNLPNVAKLQQDLEERTGQPGQYLICLDVLALRHVNDAYDRTTGDLLLKSVAQWLGEQEFGQECLYRIEGDEFCLYLTGASAKQAEDVARRVEDRFRRAWHLFVGRQEITILVGASVALIELRDDIPTGEVVSVMERVLGSLTGTGGLVLHNEEMDRKHREHVRMEMSLKKAVQNGMQGFSVHFQPIAEPASGTWKGLEALCRWTDPDTQKPVPPLVFIKEAEQLGLIRPIGMFVLTTAMAQCKKWGLDAVEGFFLSVNLSPDQVMDHDFVDQVTGLMKEYDFPGKCLALEVTESTEFTFNEYSLDVIDKLRFRGVRFSLDDFGTGYSSFNNLENLPVSMLKTEREFIWGIEEDNYMQYFFYSMAELAHAADMKLIAEGVETAEQLAIILKNGGDYVQGYYFSKPLPAEEMGKNLVRFVQVDPAFYKLHSQRLTADSIFSGKEGYLNSPKLFKLLNHSMQVLLSEVDADAAFGQVLEMIGKHFGVSRGYVYYKKQEGGFVGAHEWCSPGVRPLSEGFTDASVAANSWVPSLHDDGMIVAADVAVLPEDIRDFLNSRGVKSLAVIPMFDEGELSGFVGFENYHFREWLPEEIVLLRNLSLAMSTSVKRQRLQQQVYQNDVRFSDVLNHMSLAVMVTDPQTDEILWVNEAMPVLYGITGNPVGRKCHDVIYGCDKRCEHCRVDNLLKNPYVRQYSWENHVKRLDRYVMVNDSLVRWEGGKRVHLQYSMDITDIKHTQRKLEQFATTDSLTDTRNRKSLIVALRARVQEAHEGKTPLSIAFVDIDRLKYANDTYGHSFGDELILETVKALRSVMGPEDLIGRYGGDEFIVLMPQTGAAQAEKRMEAARELVHALKYGPLGDDFSFSYGVVQSDELPYAEGEKVVNTLVNLADDRMRDYKKIKRAGMLPQEARPDDGEDLIRMTMEMALDDIRSAGVESILPQQVMLPEEDDAAEEAGDN